MSKIILYLFVFVYFISNYSDAQEERNYFRSDYTFIEETQAFYKYHTTAATWEEAKQICEMEGAKLFYPKNEAETRAVLSFWKAGLTIFIGISAAVVKGVFVTIDGIPVANVYNVWQPGEPNNVGSSEDCVMLYGNGKFNDINCSTLLPFICKKSQSELKWNKPCNMPDLEYTYDKEEGKCYKFHKTARSWTDAYITCNGEKSYLAVINSKRERDYLLSLTRDQITEFVANKSIHIGFHNRFNKGWQTLQGKTLQDSGYAHWDRGQPDGSNREEECGDISYTGELHDVQCDSTSYFICEHDINVK